MKTCDTVTLYIHRSLCSKYVLKLNLNYYDIGLIKMHKQCCLEVAVSIIIYNIIQKNLDVKGYDFLLAKLSRLLTWLS